MLLSNAPADDVLTVSMLDALVQLTDKALGLWDERRRADLTRRRHPVHSGDVLVVDSLVHRRRRADVAATVDQLVDVGHEWPVQAEDVADTLL